MKKYFFFLLSLFFFYSCSLSNEQKALKLLTEASDCVKRSELNAAKLYLDSIHLQYARQISVRRQADSLLWKIQLVENKRTLLYVDSLLPVKIAEMEQLKPAFIFQKDSLYQDFGIYVHRTMTTGRNAERCYLKPYVDERGVSFLLSHYFGKSSLSHKTLQIDADGVFLSTKTEGNFNSFREEGLLYETLLFENCTEFLDFVVEHRDSRIRISLHGDRKYAYILMPSDKEAFCKTQMFSVVVADVYRLKQERKKALLKVEHLNKKIKN